MKARISIDIRKNDEWGLVSVELGNTRRYLGKPFVLEGKSNKELVDDIRAIVDNYIKEELLKELDEEDSWKDGKS